MSTGRSSATYGVRSFASLLIRRYRASPKTTAITPDYQHMSSGMKLSKCGHGSGGLMHHRLSISSGDPTKSQEEHEINLKVHPSDPDPTGADIFSWVKWLLGSMLPLMFSFWKQKLDSTLKLEGKVEEVVKEAEEVAEVIERVATTTEKLSAEVAEKLDSGDLKKVASMVEHVSTAIAKDARMTEDFIHKVGDLKEDLSDLEAMVKPVIDKKKHK